MRFAKAVGIWMLGFACIPFVMFVGAVIGMIDTLCRWLDSVADSVQELA